MNDQNKKSKLKIGVLGVGKMGELHLKKLKMISSVEVVGFYDHNSNRSRGISETYSVPPFANVEDLFFEADAVIIASPTATHFSFAKSALSAGVHVLVEKPPTENAEQLDFLIQMADAAKLVLQVGFLERFRLAPFWAAKKMSHTLFSLERHTKSPGRESGLDVVLDLMIHDLDLLAMFIPEEPIRVEATGSRLVSPLWDQVQARLTFPSGRAAHLSANRTAPRPSRRFFLSGPEAVMEVDLNLNSVFISSADEKGELRYTEQSLETEDPLLVQNEHFIRCILDQTSPLTSAQNVRRALAWGTAIQAALQASVMPLPSVNSHSVRVQNPLT